MNVPRGRMHIKGVSTFAIVCWNGRKARAAIATPRDFHKCMNACLGRNP